MLVAYEKRECLTKTHITIRLHSQCTQIIYSAVYPHTESIYVRSFLFSSIFHLLFFLSVDLSFLLFYFYYCLTMAYSCIAMHCTNVSRKALKFNRKQIVATPST